MSGYAITGWSAVSPYGIGAKAFAEGVSASPPAPSRLPVDAGHPGDLAQMVPEFDIRAVLGRKGTRSMDRVSALAVSAVGELLEADERHRRVGTGNRAALVLGTTAGSAQSMVDITRDMLVRAMPFHIDAARIPNGVMNGAAAQCAIWHRLMGPNTTVGGGRAAGFSALRYSQRLLDADRAEAVLCGGAEELSAARAWLEFHGAASRPGGAAVLGEGAALLLVERAGPDVPALAELLAVEVGVFPGGGNSAEPASGLAAGLSRGLRRSLVRSGVTPEQVWAVGSDPIDGPLGAAEMTAIAAVFDDVRTTLPDGRPWGDAGAVTVPFLVATLLTRAGRLSGGPRIGVVTAVDRDGVYGCAVLRLAGTDGMAGAGRRRGRT